MHKVERTPRNDHDDNDRTLCESNECMAEKEMWINLCRRYLQSIHINFRYKWAISSMHCISASKLSVLCLLLLRRRVVLPSVFRGPLNVYKYTNRTCSYAIRDKLSIYTCDSFNEPKTNFRKFSKCSSWDRREHIIHSVARAPATRIYGVLNCFCCCTQCPWLSWFVRSDGGDIERWIRSLYKNA